MVPFLSSCSSQTLPKCTLTHTGMHTYTHAHVGAYSRVKTLKPASGVTNSMGTSLSDGTLKPFLSLCLLFFKKNLFMSKACVSAQEWHLELEDPKCQRTLGYRKDMPKLECWGRKVEFTGNMEITAALGSYTPQLRICQCFAAVWLPKVSVSSEGLRWWKEGMLSFRIWKWTILPFPDLRVFVRRNRTNGSKYQ